MDRDKTPQTPPKRKLQARVRARIPTYAAARAKGLSRAKAGELAGYSPGETARKEGERLEKLPETQEAIEKFRAKYDLGADRAFRELDRGLKESAPEGKHGDYLDRLLKVNGIAQDKGGQGEGSQIIVGLIDALASAKAQQFLQKSSIPADAVPEAQPPA